MYRTLRDAPGAAFVCMLLVSSTTSAASRQPSAAELLRAIDKLGVVGNVLYVAAHPDDEDTRLLAWLANDKLVRAGYLSLTRGEGGQNLIGAEQAPLLGLIRTEELLAARSVDGAEQWFTRARDFGYSKTPEETLAIWGHDEILADVVAVYRKFRPDVVITRFPPGERDTHGHHSASVMLAIEAFNAAEPAWRPKRVLWDRWGDAPGADEAATLARQDVGGYNAVLGLSYGEIAARSRSMHKSQGFGVAASRGEQLAWFKTLAGDPARQSIFDGVDLTWGRVAGGKKIAEHIARIKNAFSVEQPYKSVPELLALHGEMAAMPDHPWKAQKLGEVEALVVGCAGLFAEATVADATAVPGGDVKLTLQALSRAPIAVALREARVFGERIAVDKALADEKPLKIEHTLKLPAENEYTQPYWLAQPPEKGRWTVKDAALMGLPAAPPPSVELTLAFGDRVLLTIARPLVYKWTDPTAGERQRALEVVPPVTVDARAALLVFADAQPKSLTVRLKAHRDDVAGELAPELPPGWRAEPPSQKFALAKKEAEREVAFKIVPPRGETTGALKLVATVGGQRYARALQHIEYPHIPIQTLTPDADVKLVRVDARHARKRIGYIAGAGDEVPAALRQIGFDVTMLGDEAIASGSLAQYQAIVTGVRAYNVDARLPFLHDKLMKYVADGGTLVVQYNTVNWISNVPTEIGPAPFKISRDRVTDENAPITLLEPAHPIFTRPNRISARDFAGWVQERGLYYADSWDPIHRPLMSMRDPGEKETKGALLVARHGKGAFIYAALAFFRQLPAGVPGAYRLIANLIDYAP